MPNFQFPPGADGGGGGGSSPVQGGSGSFYGTIASAILGETEDAATTFAPQPGTAPGVIVGPAALNPADEFYKDYWVVNESAVPSNGLQCRYARVSKYVGATRTLTIDEPWDFVSETTIRLIRPIRLWILQDMAEDVTFTKNVELNLEGHRLRGKIDQTVGTFCWIRKGQVTNGIQKTTIGVLRLDDLAVSRRDDTLYAVLMTNGSDLGRTVLQNCHFSGAVAGRRGRAGWEVEGCRNDGVPETNRDVPYRLFESVAGVALVVVQVDVILEGEWSGAVFYSENSLTAPAMTQISLSAKIIGAKKASSLNNLTEPNQVSLCCAVGAATLTMTWPAETRVNFGVSQLVRPTSFRGSVEFVRAVDFTGTLSVSASGTISNMDLACEFSEIHVVGTAIMSGSITLSVFQFASVSGEHDYTQIFLESTCSGTISGNSTVTEVKGARAVRRVFLQGAVQDQPTLSVTLASTLEAVCHGFTFITGGFAASTAISAGTYTFSGRTDIEIEQLVDFLISLGSFVSGGTFTFSGQINVIDVLPHALSSSSIATGVNNASTGGTLTVSGTLRVTGFHSRDMSIANGSGVGSSTTMSGAITIRHFRLFQTTTTRNMIQATVVGATVVVSGTLRFEYCEFDDHPVNIVSATGSVTAPSSVDFDDCVFLGSLTDAVGAGAITWAAASLRFRDCHLGGLFTFTGTRFSTVEAFETFFNGSTANESISATGTRPTTYRLWKCGFRAIADDLKPEIIDHWLTMPSDEALTAGQLVKTMPAGTAADTDGDSIVEGVVLEATAGPGIIAVVVVLGRVFVDTAAVVAGDNLILDVEGTPTACIAGSPILAQTVGRALEATGATRAGESYSIVRVE